MGADDLLEWHYRIVLDQGGGGGMQQATHLECEPRVVGFAPMVLLVLVAMAILSVLAFSFGADRPTERVRFLERLTISLERPQQLSPAAKSMVSRYLEQERQFQCRPPLCDQSLERRYRAAYARIEHLTVDWPLIAERESDLVTGALQ
jgi:hypothetical protein